MVRKYSASKRHQQLVARQSTEEVKRLFSNYGSSSTSSIGEKYQQGKNYIISTRAQVLLHLGNKGFAQLTHT